MTLRNRLLLLLFAITSVATANSIDYMYRMAGNPKKGMKTITIERDGCKETYYLNTEAKIDSFRFRNSVSREEFMNFKYGKDTLTMYGTSSRLVVKIVSTKDSSWSYEYDKDSAKPVLTMVAQLDDHGEIVSRKVYRNGKETSGSYKRTYDSKGNCIKMEHFEGGLLVESFISKYDALGIIVEKKWFDGKGKLTAYNKYNTSGLLVEYNENGKVYLRKYKYDAKGNWIEYIDTVKNNPKAAPSCVKRTIEYY